MHNKLSFTKLLFIQYIYFSIFQKHLCDKIIIKTSHAKNPVKQGILTSHSQIYGKNTVSLGQKFCHSFFVRYPLRNSVRQNNYCAILPIHKVVRIPWKNAAISKLLAYFSGLFFTRLPIPLTLPLISNFQFCKKHGCKSKKKGAKSYGQKIFRDSHHTCPHAWRG